MIVRALVIFAALAAVSAVAAFFAANPGTVSVTWGGYRIDTSVGILLAMLAVVALIAGLGFLLWRRIWTATRSVREARGARRTRQGYLALARGLVAVAAGDADEARRLAKRANGLLREPALTQLLSAQAAQLDGDRTAARRYFTSLTERKETAFLGVRGLLTLAEQEGDGARALDLARRAEALRPEAPWVLEKLFALEIEAGNWAAAERVIGEAVKRRAITPDQAKRRRALVALEESRLAEAKHDAPGALRFARKALDAAPDLTAAAIRAASLLHAEGEDRRVRKVVEDAWEYGPHPELARLYRAAGAETDPLKRLKAFERLERQAPNHPGTHLVMARAALDAKLWGEARRHLAVAAKAGSTATLCRLIAELEEAENDDPEAARRWLAEAATAEPDPGWVCAECGAVADEWSAVCAHCGAFDSIAWASPPRVSALAPEDAAAAARAAIAAARRAPPGEVAAEPAAIVPVPPPPDVVPTTRPAAPASTPSEPPESERE
jgi:HemY protein